MEFAMHKKLMISSVILSLFISGSVLAKHYDDDDGYKKSKRLPPGLQKKLDRGGELPPGWQKKIAEGQVIDRDLYRRSKILSPINVHGEQIIRLDDRTMRIIEATGEIIHIFGQ
jgi:hypothetical protein